MKVGRGGVGDDAAHANATMNLPTVIAMGKTMTMTIRTTMVITRMCMLTRHTDEHGKIIELMLMMIVSMQMFMLTSNKQQNYGEGRYLLS